MYVIISSGTPLFCKFQTSKDLNLVDDIRIASVFKDDDIASYYLDLARNVYGTIGLHLIEVPNEIFGDNKKNIIDNLTNDEEYSILSGYHE